MLALPIIGLLIIASVNYISSRFGFSNFITGDKDILFPFTTTIFLFFSLLIYLPQVHSKIINFQSQTPNLNATIQAQQEEDQFPLAFLFSLLSVSLAVFLDKFCLNKAQNLKREDEKQLHNPGVVSTDQLFLQVNKFEVTSLKYFLTIAVLLINIFSSFVVTLEHKESSIWAQLLTFLLFSFILNFSYGYLLAWSQIQQQLANKLFLFVVSGTIVGILGGIFLHELSSIVILPCISIGLFIYTAVFICLPRIFTNGQKRVQDNFRYWAIFTALLLTLIYYPIVYLLKI